MQDGRSLRVSVRRGVGAAAQEVPEHLQAASPRCGVHGAVHHLAPEFLTDDRAGRRGQHGVEQEPEHLGAPAPGRGVEDVGDAVLPLAEDEQRLRREQVPDEAGVPGRGRRELTTWLKYSVNQLTRRFK